MSIIKECLEIGYQIPERTPFVERHFNIIRAGIHADGQPARSKGE